MGPGSGEKIHRKQTPTQHGLKSLIIYSSFQTSSPCPNSPIFPTKLPISLCFLLPNSLAEEQGWRETAHFLLPKLPSLTTSPSQDAKVKQGAFQVVVTSESNSKGQRKWKQVSEVSTRPIHGIKGCEDTVKNAEFFLSARNLKLCSSPCYQSKYLSDFISR